MFVAVEGTGDAVSVIVLPAATVLLPEIVTPVTATVCDDDVSDVFDAVKVHDTTPNENISTAANAVMIRHIFCMTDLNKKILLFLS